MRKTTPKALPMIPKTARISLLAVTLAAVPAVSQAPVIHTTTDTLAAALSVHPGMPVAVAVGRGYKAAPVRLELRCMIEDTRSGWYDAHQDASCVVVVVLIETTRVEGTVGGTVGGSAR